MGKGGHGTLAQVASLWVWETQYKRTNLVDSQGMPGTQQKNYTHLSCGPLLVDSGRGLRACLKDACALILKSTVEAMQGKQTAGEQTVGEDGVAKPGGAPLAG